MPKVYVVSPSTSSPSGGIMKLYELVDILNANHIESYIVHKDVKNRIDWYENSTPIIAIDSINIKKEDIVVIPEVIIEGIFDFFPENKKIIFCQNSFHAIKMFYGKPERLKDFYLHKNVIQVIVVSDHDFDLFQWVFPGIKLNKMIIGINEDLFFFEPAKKMQIAIMPRKLPSDFNFLTNLLKLKGDLTGFDVKIIEDVSYIACSKILRESAIFLSLSYREGFGLPPAEAMACGCVVIGYHGQGGKEFFKEDFSYSVDQWDMMHYAKCVSTAVRQFKFNPEKTIEAGKKASQFILEKYSRINQEKSILQIIKPLL